MGCSCSRPLQRLIRKIRRTPPTTTGFNTSVDALATVATAAEADTLTGDTVLSPLWGHLEHDCQASLQQDLIESAVADAEHYDLAATDRAPYIRRYDDSRGSPEAGSQQSLRGLDNVEGLLSPDRSARCPSTFNASLLRCITTPSSEIIQQPGSSAGGYIPLSLGGATESGPLSLSIWRGLWQGAPVVIKLMVFNNKEQLRNNDEVRAYCVTYMQCRCQGV